MKKLLPGVMLAMMCAGTVKAQDVHFTQYFTSPLSLNPAMTGLVAEDVRFAGNFRTQWSAVSANPYMTGTASFDVAMLKGKLPEGDALGAGLMVLYDKSGTGGLTNTTAGFSLAYHKAIGQNKQQHISIGIQTNFVQKAIDFTKLTFEDMYASGSNTLIFPTSPSVSYNTQNISYPDFNGGLMYSGKIAEHTTAYFGYSYYHITQPSESFLNTSAIVHNRQTVYLGANFDMNSNTVLYASALYQSQASATEVVMGTAVGFIMNQGHDDEYQKNTIFYLGGWYRYGDAICPYVGIEWSKVRLGVSYDVNLSNFTPATGGAGAYEISLLYFGRINKHEKNPTYSWSCPKLW